MFLTLESYFQISRSVSLTYANSGNLFRLQSCSKVNMASDNQFVKHKMDTVEGASEPSVSSFSISGETLMAHRKQ